MRTVLSPLGFLLTGVAIGYILARPMNGLTRQEGRNEMAVDFPSGSDAEREWRLRVSGLVGTSRIAL